MQIVSPGGNLEKLQYAVHYGADAVYTSYKDYGLRALADNLTFEEITKAVDFCHQNHVEIYITLNIYGRNKDIDALPEYIRFLDQTGIDAVIVSDPGILKLVKDNTNLSIHLSTQANTTNKAAARFWYEQGVKRIILARELSFSEAVEIKQHVPELELEAFIHGAMCISWSGRCLLSAVLNQRSANSGECSHPCRWNWALVEETRPGQYFPIEQDKYGTYIMNSKDICLLDEIGQMSGVISGGKIEGRMKSIYYVAALSRIYKQAISSSANVPTMQKLRLEIEKISHRPYFSGFYYGFSDEQQKMSLLDESETNNAYQREWQYCGKVINQIGGIVWFDCYSKICKGEEIEIIFPDFNHDLKLVVDTLIDIEGSSAEFTKPNQRFGIPVEHIIPEWGLLRKSISQ